MTQLTLRMGLYPDGGAAIMKKRLRTKTAVKWDSITPERLVAVTGKRTPQRLTLAAALLKEFRKLDDSFILAMRKLAQKGPWASRIAVGLLLFESGFVSDPLSGLLARQKKKPLEDFESIGTDH
jgi:hypothetical protein